MATTTEITIIQTLRGERPQAMDKAYQSITMWEKGACDEFNTIVLAFAFVLFPRGTDGGTAARWEFVRQCTQA